jgi:hypothetical protein
MQTIHDLGPSGTLSHDRHKNSMDPGCVPAHFPELSQAEEMLMARVHVHLEAKRVRGLQYQYTGQAAGTIYE